MRDWRERIDRGWAVFLVAGHRRRRELPSLGLLARAPQRLEVLARAAATAHNVLVRLRVRVNLVSRYGLRG